MKSRYGSVLTVIGLAALVSLLGGCGAEKFEPKSTGSEDYQQKIKDGKPLYETPKGAPTPVTK